MGGYGVAVGLLLDAGLCLLILRRKGVTLMSAWREFLRKAR